LLAWAAVKPWVDWFRERNTFKPLGQHDGMHGETGAVRPNASARKSEGPRNVGFQPGGARGANRGGDGDGPFAIGSYDEDTHADQDAMDIASGRPSGSGSNGMFRS
jgi:hypothetical protein